MVKCSGNYLSGGSPFSCIPECCRLSFVMISGCSVKFSSQGQSPVQTPKEGSFVGRMSGVKSQALKDRGNQMRLPFSRKPFESSFPKALRSFVSSSLMSMSP